VIVSYPLEAAAQKRAAPQESYLPGAMANLAKRLTYAP
jgi:hypothetical protein